MPETPAALLILLIAILPGVFGNIVFQARLGIDWRAQKWESLLRLLGFSMGGLVLYTILAGAIGTPPPVYVLPGTFKGEGLSIDTLYSMSLAYIGHCVASLAVGVLAVGGQWVMSLLAPVSPYAYAWEDFLRNYVPSHWVVITLSGGEAYAGILEHADTAAKPDGRDVILQEPAQFDPATRTYTALPYQTLFLPGTLVSSVAVVSDPSIDKRLTDIGEKLFQGGSARGSGNQDAGSAANKAGPETAPR